jgi:hypothetical protein
VDGRPRSVWSLVTIANDRYDEAIAPLRFRGHVPIYRFDFSDFEFMTLRWDGECWTLLEKGALFVCPGEILDKVGIKIPYWDELPPITPTPLETREALVVEGAAVEQVRVLIGDRWRIEPGPRGAIVYGPDSSTHDIRVSILFNETRFALWEQAPGRVLEIEFYPKSGNFWFRVMKGEECLGTFRPGQTRTWDGTPFLASALGETEPEAIVEKFGIPRSFLART